ncbi:glycosyltransferase [Haloferula rosea]|uniref:Glycosyltransferase n=1 Tax=Haloferula rosea TaxID=490093 RepID=A0A934REQ4_9BACT|nr:glycosyltransferase [Haloferula rosea]MBK1827829.1 glycosyltransferase [Haloferula rosea]
MKSEKQAMSQSIAVAIPCYQEALTIRKVVEDFQRELPDARIYVYDNNCTDGTAEAAALPGVIVRREKRQGKGFVVATMFEQLEEDVVIMVDGDDTYDASHVHKLLEPILLGDADMTVASRLTNHGDGSFRPMHLAGNRMVCAIINRVFGSKVTDIFSGYRAFSRDSIRHIPITTKGFDVETEMTLQALYRGQVIREVPAPYSTRPEGSFSKLNTWSDGSLVLLRLFLILKSYKPLTLFGAMGLIMAILGLAVGYLPTHDYFTNPGHYVDHVPSAILAAALMVLSMISLSVGLILNSINLRLLELERLTIRRSK